MRSAMSGSGAWIPNVVCGYVQRGLGTARVWRGVVKERRVYGGWGGEWYRPIIILCQTWICNYVDKSLLLWCNNS